MEQDQKPSVIFDPVTRAAAIFASCAALVAFVDFADQKALQQADEVYEPVSRQQFEQQYIAGNAPLEVACLQLSYNEAVLRSRQVTMNTAKLIGADCNEAVIMAGMAADPLKASLISCFAYHSGIDVMHRPLFITEPGRAFESAHYCRGGMLPVPKGTTDIKANQPRS